MSQYLSRHQVFLKSHYVRVRFAFQYGPHECTYARRWFKYTVGTNPVFMQDVRKGVGDLFRSIESGQYGAFQRVGIPLVFRIIFAVFTNKPEKFHGRGKQFEVGFRPMDGICQFFGRVQNAL